MAFLPVTENLSESRDVSHPAIEVVEFTTQSKADYYICKKLSIVDVAFATNTKTDNKEIQVSWSTQSNGNVKITLVTEEVVTTGYLTIFGRK